MKGRNLEDRDSPAEERVLRLNLKLYKRDAMVIQRERRFIRAGDRSRLIADCYFGSRNG